MVEEQKLLLAALIQDKPPNLIHLQNIPNKQKFPRQLSLEQQLISMLTTRRGSYNYTTLHGRPGRDDKNGCFAIPDTEEHFLDLIRGSFLLPGGCHALQQFRSNGDSKESSTVFFIDIDFKNDHGFLSLPDFWLNEKNTFFTILQKAIQETLANSNSLEEEVDLVVYVMQACGILFNQKKKSSYRLIYPHLHLDLPNTIFLIQSIWDYFNVHFGHFFDTIQWETFFDGSVYANKRGTRLIYNDKPEKYLCGECKEFKLQGQPCPSRRCPYERIRWHKRRFEPYCILYDDGEIQDANCDWHHFVTMTNVRRDLDSISLNLIPKKNHHHYLKIRDIQKIPCTEETQDTNTSANKKICYTQSFPSSTNKNETVLPIFQFSPRLQQSMFVGVGLNSIWLDDWSIIDHPEEIHKLRQRFLLSNKPQITNDKKQISVLTWRTNAHFPNLSPILFRSVNKNKREALEENIFLLIRPYIGNEGEIRKIDYTSTNEYRYLRITLKHGTAFCPFACLLDKKEYMHGTQHLMVILTSKYLRFHCFSTRCLPTCDWKISLPLCFCQLLDTYQEETIE